MGFILLTSGLANAESYEFRFPIKGLTAKLAESAPAGASQIECGHYHCYALVNGTIWSVGRNDYGQLGLGDTTRRTTWDDTEHEATAIAAGDYHGYALSGGRVWSVGQNNHGQIGRSGPTTIWSNTHQTATHIAAGRGSGYALSGGVVWSLGRNDAGQLGLGDTTNRSVWTEMPKDTF